MNLMNAWNDYQAIKCVTKLCCEQLERLVKKLKVALT